MSAFVLYDIRERITREGVRKQVYRTCNGKVHLNLHYGIVEGREVICLSLLEVFFAGKCAGSCGIFWPDDEIILIGAGLPKP